MQQELLAGHPRRIQHWEKEMQSAIKDGEKQGYIDWCASHIARYKAELLAL